MKRQYVTWIALVILAGTGAPASAQTRKEYSPQFLRAAIGSIRDRSRVAVVGEFDASTGLKATTQSWLRGKGFSRFTVKDPKTGFTFDSMYCHHESEAFRDLLNVSTRRVYRFIGQKDEGEEREDAVIVETVQMLSEIKPEEEQEQEAPEVKEDRPLRVTITDEETGTKTVLVNVVKGQVYKLEGLSLVIEDEPEVK